MDMDRYIGRLLDDRYEILEVIGTGGMAVVYKARCHRLNRLVAIKILKDELIQDEEFRRRFHGESQAVAAMSHPNIVSVYDVSATDDADYIVMELIDGITLKQYMEKKGVLNWKETLHFAIQIAKALDHAHSRGIIHRDIKPHNVMVLKNGSVKVADFGIAQMVSTSNTLTKEALGSVHYISPEQARGGRVDNRSDLYSLGVVMYEMMTGRPPFDGETPVSVAIQHINATAPIPSSLNPNIPDGLEQIILKAMEKEPGKRYDSANAMLHDMDEFRKNPDILFDYNNPHTDIDEATRIHTTAEPPVTSEQQPEKGKREPAKKQPRKQPASQTQKKKRRKEVIVEDEGRLGRIGGLVLVFLSLVAIVAIVIFMVSLFGDQTIVDNKNLVTVPNLQNKVWEEAAKATDYIVKLDQYSYSSIYEKGRIISQNPDAGTRINKGDTVTVVVSAGPEPAVKKMEDLTDLDEQTAINYLVNTQGVNRDIIQVITETSTNVKEGRVIRTDPEAETPLTDVGIIKIYVSSGPKSKSVTMVDFTSAFYNEESAVAWLISNGFNNYTVQYVESNVPAGKVISQSVTPGKIVDVNTMVVLLVSKAAETQPPTQPPTIVTDPEDYVSKRVEITLPQNINHDYVLSIYRGDTLIEERDILVGTLSAEFTLTGKGIMTFHIRLSTGMTWDLPVNFDIVNEPEEPDVPDVPDEPDVPAGPTVPNEPSEPTEPEEPETPTVPSDPLEPTEPNEPNLPNPGPDGGETV